MKDKRSTNCVSDTQRAVGTCMACAANTDDLTIAAHYCDVAAAVVQDSLRSTKCGLGNIAFAKQMHGGIEHARAQLRERQGERR